ncbi:ROK family protein [Candidatus Peribacteria bacterium]|nr:MAG: ROK family protein [Candidatus Peribacteria bacterium]
MKNTSVIGIDLGGTKTIIARYDAITYERQTEERIATNASAGLDIVLRDCMQIAAKMRTPTTTGVGVGIAGLIRQPEGVVIHTPNISAGKNIRAKELLEKELKLPVRVANDAGCFALAEAMLGAGKGKKIVVGITMGTGVGGGIVIDGKIFGGSHGFAGEIGHMLLMPGKPPYHTDDMRGDVEQFLSGTAMGRRCTAAQKPQDYLEGEVCDWLQPHVFEETAWLATNLTYLLNPDIIVFGGSAGRALMPHMSKVRDELKKWTLPETPLPELAVAALDGSGALGAALLLK